MPFLDHTISSVGGREHNEDACGSNKVGTAACWAVADGLGGHRGGETASSSAVDAVLKSFQSEPQLSIVAMQHHLEAAEQAVLNAQVEQSNLSTMRTTIVVLMVDSNRALWAHMGDSRLYCFEKGKVGFRTTDHSVIQMMVAGGDLSPDQARHHKDRNRLLRCLGNREGDFKPTILPEPRTVDTRTAFLLCTDGFWDNVTDSEMEVDLAKADTPQEWLRFMEDRLLERSAEGEDNYTAIGVMLNS